MGEIWACNRNMYVRKRTPSAFTSTSPTYAKIATYCSEHLVYCIICKQFARSVRIRFIQAMVSDLLHLSARTANGRPPLPSKSNSRDGWEYQAWKLRKRTEIHPCGSEVGYYWTSRAIHCNYTRTIYNKSITWRTHECVEPSAPSAL